MCIEGRSISRAINASDIDGRGYEYFSGGGGMGSSSYDWYFLLDAVDRICLEISSSSDGTVYAAGGGGGESRSGDPYRG